MVLRIVLRVVVRPLFEDRREEESEVGRRGRWHRARRGVSGAADWFIEQASAAKGSLK